jgi:CHAT domain-containing protein
MIWSALENGADSMSLISEEPYIPWELMVPYQTVQNPRKPLGVEIRFGRWVVGDYKSPRQRIPLKSAYIVRPKTSGLMSAQQEVNFFTQLKPDFAPADEIIPADFTGVNKGLAGPSRNVIHLICHGKSAALQTLELNKPDTLDCAQVRTLKGFHAAFKDGPLAFLNACEVGGQVVALDGVGGFANSFIELGASAVIAPLWPVQDKVALDVTQTFYPQALKGVPFAEVMKQIRAKAYAQAVDSYAAYCFYGDPMAAAALP